MTTENFRFYIKVRTALRIPARVIYDELNSVYGDEAPGLSTIERWSKLFRDGREEVEDKPRPGRPISETTTENIEQVRLLIDDDPYITIEATTTTSSSITTLLDNTNNDKKIDKSSIHQHEKETGHRMNWSNFQIVWQDNHYYRLLIKELLLIKAYEPELNKTTDSVLLLVFPDGLPKVQLPDLDH
ncbi:unnamed protein product [Rotaria sordida]|uniref:Mos1 transposase HTH domain-containing protein n=1 Tax=Rotaria sordida TaxID=392033 RepID=A0A815S5U5_9BILA|nr:unnamed protein product [Rotaria sordida]